MTDVRGRTAFITGGANGIGLGIARTLAAAGVRLALVDLDVDALGRAKSELMQTAPVETYRLDVRDRESYAAIVDEVEATLGPVTLLFNNAGVAGGAPAEKLTYELWDWGIGINLDGVINGVQTFLPRMIKGGAGGHIVNTASGAGLAATSSGVLYCTAKYGVVGLSEALHFELAAAGIGVSVLCPGPVATDIMARSDETLPSAGLTDEQKARRAERRALMTAALKQGVGTDAVGAMVLDAVTGNKLYIHTDRVMEERIKERTRALLAAMPE